MHVIIQLSFLVFYVACAVYIGKFFIQLIDKESK